MRTDEEIKEYLNLYNHEDINKIIETAKKIEKKYPQIKNGTYGYGLQCDFDNSPFILEDEDLTEMKEIERIDGIVVYEIIDKGDINMKFIVENNEEIINFDNGTDVYIFDCVTNTIRNKEDALECTDFIRHVYLKDNNYTPLGHLCDYIAERWYEGIKDKEINDIVQDFYDTLY